MCVCVYAQVISQTHTREPSGFGPKKKKQTEILKATEERSVGFRPYVDRQESQIDGPGYCGKQTTTHSTLRQSISLTAVMAGADPRFWSGRGGEEAGGPD